jgi:hypothetical protein
MHRLRTTLLFGVTLLLSGAAWAQAPAAEKPAAPAADKIKKTLRWQTSDIDSRGYDVYRADSESGPFVKLTARPIDGHVRGPKGEFAYVDETIEPGKVYWYYVEVIDVLGERRKFTPLMKAPAKGPAPSPTASAAPKP